MVFKPMKIKMVGDICNNIAKLTKCLQNGQGWLCYLVGKSQMPPKFFFFFLIFLGSDNTFEVETLRSMPSNFYHLYFSLQLVWPWLISWSQSQKSLKIIGHHFWSFPKVKYKPKISSRFHVDQVPDVWI